MEEKKGRSGSLLFVTVRHAYVQHGRVAIHEEHDIVSREPMLPRLGDADVLAAAEWSETIVPPSTLLFRYSALTFTAIASTTTGPTPPRRKARPAWWCTAR